MLLYAIITAVHRIGGKSYVKEEEMADINDYEHVVSEFYTTLFKYVYYRLGSNKELTEETVNDVFCVLYKKWHNLDREDNLLGWLYHVADLEMKQQRRKHMKYYNHNESLEETIAER